MERTKLFFNEEAYKRHKFEYKQAEGVLNEYVEMLKNLVNEHHEPNEAKKRIEYLNPETAKFSLFTGNWNKASRPQLYKHIQELTYDLLVQDDYLGGIRVNKQEAFKLLDMPEDSIKEIVDYVHGNTINNDPDIHGKIDLSQFEIKSGKVSLKSTFDKKLKEQHTIYATNERQLELYESAKRLKEEFEDLYAKGAIALSFIKDVNFLRLVPGNDNKPAKVELNYDWIKTA